MFVSVKERARQIANGQFIAPTTSSPVTSLIDLAPESQLANDITLKKTNATETHSKASAPPSKTKSSKAAQSKEPTLKAGSTKASVPPTPVPVSAPLKPARVPETTAVKKSSSKSKVSKESNQKPPSPKIGTSKSASTPKSAPQTKGSSPVKVVSPTKTASAAKLSAAKPTSTSSPKSKRQKSPPRRVDSPVEDDEDPLSALKTACLKQVSGVTGLGGRRLAIVLKQRSSGGWYAALKDTGSDKYLKMWTNKDKTSATKGEALEAYLLFVTKMRNEVRWFPMSPRASSPKGKGK